jgi:uncharacterized membrane protein (DUF485 family)
MASAVPAGSSPVKSARAMLGPADFKQLVARRWRVSMIPTTALFVIYYGYILLIAVDKPLLAQKVGEVTTLGIPVGVAVIVLAWALTAAYVVWANRVYDLEPRRLREQVGK